MQLDQRKRLHAITASVGAAFVLVACSGGTAALDRAADEDVFAGVTRRHQKGALAGD